MKKSEESIVNSVKTQESIRSALRLAGETNGWSAVKVQAVQNFSNELQYQHIVNWFFLYDLKRLEERWSWMVIVMSTLTSTVSLLDLDAHLDSYYTRGLTSFFSLSTTLMASWLKKNNYVERIKMIDRHIQQITKLSVEIEAQLNREAEDRLPYGTFMEKFEPQTLDILAQAPPMSPEEWKASVYRLTKYYPELVKDTYPWYTKIDGVYRLTVFGRDILVTYHSVRYSSFSKRLFSCYYCRSKCCRKEPRIMEIYRKGTPKNETRRSLEVRSALYLDRTVPEYDVESQVENTRNSTEVSTTPKCFSELPKIEQQETNQVDVDVPKMDPKKNLIIAAKHISTL